MSQRNENFNIYMSRTQNTKNKFFSLVTLSFSSLDCFSITKKLHESSTACQILRDHFHINEIGDEQILPQTQTCKFGRTKFDTHTVLSRDEVLISLFTLLQVLLSSMKYMKLPKFDILVDKTSYLFKKNQTILKRQLISHIKIWVS